MMVIDMTNELSLLLSALNVGLVLSTVAVFGGVLARAWSRAMPRPRPSFPRPALAGAR